VWTRRHIEAVARKHDFGKANIIFLCDNTSYIAANKVDELIAVQDQQREAVAILHELFDDLQRIHRLGRYRTAVPDATASSSTPAPAGRLRHDLDGTLRDMSANVEEGEKLLSSVSGGGKRRNPHTNVMDEDEGDEY